MSRRPPSSRNHLIDARRFQVNVLPLGGALLIMGVCTPFLAQPALAQTPPTDTVIAPPATPISVTVDGKPVDFGGAAPSQVGGRTLVPLRAIFEALGAQVNFNAGTIQAKRGDTQLQLTIGSSQAFVNGSPRTLDVPAQAIFGRTLVPLRFVGEALGAAVKFDAATQTIAIASPEAGAPIATGPEAPYTVPGAGQSISGTLVKIDNSPPATVTLSIDGALKTYPLAPTLLALRQISLAVTPTATPSRQPARQIPLSSLFSGDPVKLGLDATGKVIQITTAATVIVAKVQFAGNDQIVLDDDRDTTLTIGPNIRFVDATGRISPTVSALGAGQSIGLFLSRESRAIYQVSAFAPDFTAAAVGGNNSPDPLPGNNPLPPAGAPQIQLVQHNANTPLKAGSRLEVTVRATPGLTGNFSLGPKVQNIALTEDATRPGVYGGAYIIKTGDDILNGRVSARMVNAAGLEDFAQSTEPVTVDTVPPRLIGTFPANGAQIAVAQPNIAIFADDLGGSGLGGAQIDLITGSLNNPVTTRIPATVAPPTSINAVAPSPLSGQIGVRAIVTDKAGNTLTVPFSFTTIANAGAITSFAHGANRAEQPGEDVPLLLSAQPAGRASFDVLTAKGAAIARDVPMTETEPGRFRATYRVPTNASGNLRFVGKFTGTDGVASQLEATTKVQIAGLPAKLSIQSPTDGDKVTTPLTVKGQASPGATIDISLRAEGTQFFILEYKQELGVKQVRADAGGNWTTSLDLPALRNVSGLRYVMSATQTDAAGKVSDPVVVTVTR